MRYIFLHIFLFLGLVNTFGQTTRTLFAIQDNTIFETIDNDPSERSNAVGNHLYVGVAKNKGIRRGLTQFDLEDLNIPAGEEILEAKLILTANLKGNAQPYLYQIHRVNKFWTEGTSDADGNTFANGGNGVPSTFDDCSWIRNYVDDPNDDAVPNDLFWDNEGGDFVLTPSASNIIQRRDVHEVEFEDPQLINDINDMIDNPLQNFGWIILQENDEALSTTNNNTPYAVRFYSSEAPEFDPSDQVNIPQTPKLVITYGEAPLSINPVNFTIESSDLDKVILQWEVSDIEGISHFLLRKSTDGINFFDWITIPANGERRFQYVDNQPFSGVNYYQFNVVADNGNIINSQIQKMELALTTDFKATILNNGQAHHLQLQTNTNTAQTVQLLIYNTTGKLLLKQDALISKGQQVQTFELTGLRTGSYFITIQNQKQAQILQWIRS